MYKIYSVLLFLLVGISEYDIEGTDVTRPACVVVGDIVNVRARPDIHSEVIDVATYGEVLIFTGYTQEYSNIDGVRGRWATVCRNLHDRSGYIFEPYVADPIRGLGKVNEFVPMKCEFKKDNDRGSSFYYFKQDGTFTMEFVWRGRVTVRAVGQIYKKQNFYVVAYENGPIAPYRTNYSVLYRDEQGRYYLSSVGEKTIQGLCSVGR